MLVWDKGRRLVLLVTTLRLENHGNGYDLGKRMRHSSEILFLQQSFVVVVLQVVLRQHGLAWLIVVSTRGGPVFH